MLLVLLPTIIFTAVNKQIAYSQFAAIFFAGIRSGLHSRSKETIQIWSLHQGPFDCKLVDIFSYCTTVRFFRHFFCMLPRRFSLDLGHRLFSLGFHRSHRRFGANRSTFADSTWTAKMWVLRLRSTWVFSISWQGLTTYSFDVCFNTINSKHIQETWS